MRRAIVGVSVLLYTLPTLLSAQQDDLDLERLEIPPLSAETSVPYFGIGGGFVGLFLFPELEALNAKLQQWGMGTMSAPLFVSGIEGFATVGLIPNVRVGFFGIGGRKELQSNFHPDTQRQAELGITATGLAIAYAVVLVRSVTILPALAGGWGMMSVELAQAPSRTRWDELPPQGAVTTFLQRLTASYLFLHPQLYVEYAPLPFLLLRLGGGYQFSFVGEWKQNRIAVTDGVPQTLKASGASAQFSIFVGLFN